MSTISFSKLLKVSFIIIIYSDLNYLEIGKKRITKNVSDNHEFRMLSVACLQYFNMQAALIMAYMNFGANENLRQRSQSQSKFEFSTHLYIVGPYDEYSMRWYVTVGLSILIAVIF